MGEEATLGFGGKGDEQVDVAGAVEVVTQDRTEGSQLGDLPKIAIEGCSNRSLGTKVTRFFKRMPCAAYELRHCYARRALEFGYAPEFGAKMMGHSAEVHCRTYRRWIDESTYWAIYQKGISGGPKQGNRT